MIALITQSKHPKTWNDNVNGSLKDTNKKDWTQIKLKTLSIWYFTCLKLQLLHIAHSRIIFKIFWDTPIQHVGLKIFSKNPQGEKIKGWNMELLNWICIFSTSLLILSVFLTATRNLCGQLIQSACYLLSVPFMCHNQSFQVIAHQLQCFFPLFPR